MLKTSLTSAATTTPGISSFTTPEPVLPDLEVTSVNKQITNPTYSAALPGGEAYVVHKNIQVVKINSTGQTVKGLYDSNTGNSIRGLVLVGSFLYVIHHYGDIIEIQPHTGQLPKPYTIPDVNYVANYASLYSDPSEVRHTDTLHFVDYFDGNVFSYNLTSGVKQVHVSGLDYPTSVSYSFSHDSIYYIVCQEGNSMVNVYNSSWGLVSSFGGYGSKDGDLNGPFAAIVTSNTTIMVADTYNKRMSVFTTKGDFLYNLVIDELQSKKPESLSYFKPWLWIRHFTVKGSGLYRYNLNQ